MTNIAMPRTALKTRIHLLEQMLTSLSRAVDVAEREPHRAQALLAEAAELSQMCPAHVVIQRAQQAISAMPTRAPSLEPGAKLDLESLASDTAWARFRRDASCITESRPRGYIDREVFLTWARTQPGWPTRPVRSQVTKIEGGGTLTPSQFRTPRGRGRPVPKTHPFSRAETHARGES